LTLLQEVTSDPANRLPEGIKVFGTTTLLGMPSLDSVSSLGDVSGQNERLIGVMASVLGQVSFPQRTLGLGDAFEEVTELPLTVAGEAFRMKVVSTYTLAQLNGEEAGFDVQQRYFPEEEHGEVNGLASGTGQGSLIYDIAAEFITHQTSETSLAMRIAFDEFSIHLTQYLSHTQKTTIHSDE
jgi:hypothetical protein